jgi:penicillin-binding protein 1A
MRKRIEPFRHFWDERPELLDAFIRETPSYRKAVAAGQPEAAALARLKSDAKFMAQLRAGKTRLEAGFVALDPSTGEVKAWVGSRDFERDQFDHVAQAERQPGSTFKPIVYGAALERGMRPDHAYQDGPVEIRSVDGSIWRPTDMSGSTGRLMSMREGLVYSKNTITVQVMRDVGLPSIIDLAKAVGVSQSKLDPVPSLSLGTSPVTLLEMVSAYSTIAQVGAYRKPLMVKRITDRAGKVLAEFGTESRRAMSEDTAVELIDMMRGAVTRGTGQAVKTHLGFAADIAGKTGTTQNNTDGWFILMHPNLVAGAWVGFNDSRVTMRSDYWGQGGHNAVMVVGDFFKDALKSRLVNVKAKFPKPKRPPPMMVQAPSEDWLQQLDAGGRQMPSGYGMVTSRSGETFVVGPNGVRKVERQQSAHAEAARDGFGRGYTEASGGSDPGGSAMSGR